jgi:hypothetical protein
MPQTFNVGARSRFVTVIAWVFIVIGTIATVSALMQNAAVASLLLGASLPGAAPALPPYAYPPVTGLLLGYLPWVVGFGLAMSMATLASAIGLLLRLDWARRVFIGLLVVAIVFNLLGLWLQHEVVHALVQSTLTLSALPPQAADVFGGFVTAARAMALVMTLAACAVLGWIIRCLQSPPVRQEFA